MNYNNNRRGSLVWPVMLIGVGVVFLLNNLGIISWNVWALLLRMWPVLLVAVGLDLLFGRRSGIAAAIVVVVTIGMFAGFFWLLNLTGEVWAGEAVTESFVYEMGGAEEADIYLEQNIGELLVGSLDEEDGLFASGEVMLGEGETLRKSYSVEDDAIQFSLSSGGQQYYPSWLFIDDQTGDKTWEVDFTQHIPLDIDVNTGVGRTELDLREIILSSLTVDGGVGEVLVYLPDSGDYSVSVDAGVGKIEVRVPEDIGAEIHIDAGVGNVTVLGDYDSHGGVYYSQNYENADYQATIYLDGGVGNIRVVEIGD